MKIPKVPSNRKQHGYRISIYRLEYDCEEIKMDDNEILFKHISCSEREGMEPLANALLEVADAVRVKS